MRKNYRVIAIVLTLMMMLGLLSGCAGRSYKSTDKKLTGEILRINSNAQNNEVIVDAGTTEEYKEVESTTGGGEENGGKENGEQQQDDPSGENGGGNTEDPTKDDDDNGNTPTGGDDDDEEMEDWNTSCMSFNVLQYDTHHTGYASPKVRSDWILDTIKKYDPDLLGTQEVTAAMTATENFDMFAKLTEELGKTYNYRSVIQEKGAAISSLTIGSGLVIFYKKARFELKDSGCKVYNNDKGRHYQWVKLYDTQEKITILMTNTHFSINPSSDSAAGQQLRNAQGGELVTFWDKNCKDSMALYATGDYNHGKSEPAYTTLSSSHFISSRDCCMNKNADSGIDFVYINNDVQDCYEYHRCNETYETGKGVAIGDGSNRNAAFCPSDHYAIIAYCSNAYL